LLLMHFSGHGLKSESGELFFAASNTRPNRLGSTAVSADFVRRCMRDSRSRSVVLLLDCCYGGAFAQGVRVRATGDVHVLDSFPQERSAGRGRAVITASSAMEYAFEGDQLADDKHRRPSVFTSALVDGLATGDADRDEDGWVSLNELYDYLFEKVRERNPHQTPSRQFELAGELYLARSRRRRIRPTLIPPDLQAAMASPDMYARLGAVGELRSRLVSDNLPVAVAAYDALAELARTDIRYVAEPAAAALTEAAVQPAETELHFGIAEQGSVRPHQIVQLFGPPIARACVPNPSHAWIHVDQVAEGLDISIDTIGTGTLRGTLGLKGHAGEAVIAIAIDLVSPPAQANTFSDLIAPSSLGIMDTPIHTDEPTGPPASQLAPESLHSPSDGSPQTTDTASLEISEQPRPAGHVPLAESQSSKLQPVQPEEERQPETAKVPVVKTVPYDRTVPEDTSAPAKPAHGEAPLPTDSQEGLSEKTTEGGPELQSSFPFVWAAGSAVLGVVLVVGALIPFVSGSSQQTLWQTVLAVAVLGVLIVGFERPFKQLGTFVHGWNYVFFTFLALFVLKLHGTNIVDAIDGFTALLAVGALGNAICSAFSLVARGGRGSSNISLFITTSLITVGLAVLALGNANGSRGLSRGGGIVLLIASIATLLESVRGFRRKVSIENLDDAIACPALR